MSKRLKQLIVQQLTAELGEVEEAVLLDYGGLTAEESVGFRSTLREAGISVNVVKNTLARRVFLDRGIEVPDSWFEGPTAVASGGENAVVTSKALDDWRKANKKEMKFRGGLLAGEPLDSAAAEKLAKMPSPEELKGMVVSLVASPLIDTVSVVNNILAGMPLVLQAIADKKKEEGE